MNDKLIKHLAITDGIYDCITDPYDKDGNGDYYSSVMHDLKRFTEKIVLECTAVCDEHPGWTAGMIANEIKNKFGL